MRATHRGTCQVCGTSTKLPDGRVAKHGYTRSWGGFDQVCPGAGKLPYELARGALEDQINALALKAIKLEREIIELEDPDSWAWAWMLIQDNPGHHSQPRHWAKCKIRLDQNGVVEFKHPATGMWVLTGFESASRDLREGAVYFNRRKCVGMRLELSSILQAKIKQGKRFDAWEYNRDGLTSVGPKVDDDPRRSAAGSASAGSAGHQPRTTAL